MNRLKETLTVQTNNNNDGCEKQPKRQRINSSISSSKDSFVSAASNSSMEVICINENETQDRPNRQSKRKRSGIYNQVMEEIKTPEKKSYKSETVSFFFTVIHLPSVINRI